MDVIGAKRSSAGGPLLRALAGRCAALSSIVLAVLVLAPAAHAQLSWSGAMSVDSGSVLGWVACPSASQCTAVDVGEREVTFNPAHPGTPAPMAIDNAGNVNGLACPSVSQCSVVDTAAREVTFDPAKPGKPTPRPIDNNALLGPACPSVTQCTAVDSFAYEETFNPDNPGTPAPSLVYGRGDIVNVLACPTVGQCTAVDTGGYEVTFNPATPGTPTPTRIDSGQFTGVSGLACPSTSQCTAVDNMGREITFSPGSPGTPRPMVIDSGNSLTGIACPSTAECVAVDQQGNVLAGDPLNSAAWSRQKVAKAGTGLKAVACPTATECVAIDNAGDAYVGLSAATKAFPPKWAGLAALWNHYACFANSRHCHTSEMKLMRRTATELDADPAAAARFFGALDRHGVAAFVYASQDIAGSQGEFFAGTLLRTEFPQQLVPTGCRKWGCNDDGVQVLAIALHSGKLSTARATALTLSFLHPKYEYWGHNSLSGTPPPPYWSQAVADLAAITTVDYYWRLGRLLSPRPGSVGHELLWTAVKSKYGWNTIIVGAAAYAARRLPAANPPTVHDLKEWVVRVTQRLVTPIVNAMGANWVKVAEQDEFARQANEAGIFAIVEAFIPNGALSQLVGLTLSMWGASDTSGIAAEYTHVLKISDENQAMGDLFCVEGLLAAGRIYPRGSYAHPLSDTKANLKKVWKAYVKDSSAYKVIDVRTGEHGHPHPIPDSLDETPLGVPRFIAGSPSS